MDHPTAAKKNKAGWRAKSHLFISEVRQLKAVVW